MIPPFDIFRVAADKPIEWAGAELSLKAAKLRVLKLMACSPSKYLILSHRTNNRLVIKPPIAVARDTKPSVFQIAYTEALLLIRAGLLRAAGYEVTSVLGNEAAKNALASHRNCDLFIVGHAAHAEAREEMVRWLKTTYPQVPILALNPAINEQLSGADYNASVDSPEEWLTVVETIVAG